MKAFAIFGVIVLVLSTHYAEALQCYDCEGFGRCDESSANVVPCYFSCLKLWTDKMVVRKCAPKILCKFAAGECESCNEDLCNVAAPVVISWMAFFLTAFMLVQQIRNL